MNMPNLGPRSGVEIDDTDDPLNAATKLIRNRKPLGILNKFEMGDSLRAADEALEGQRGAVHPLATYRIRYEPSRSQQPNEGRFGGGQR